MQTLALTIFLIWSAATVALFVYVALSGRSPGELSLKGYKRARVLLLLGLTTAAVILLALTLPITPYPDEGVVPDRVIYASGKQFAPPAGGIRVGDVDRLAVEGDTVGSQARDGHERARAVGIDLQEKVPALLSGHPGLLLLLENGF